MNERRPLIRFSFLTVIYCSLWIEKVVSKDGRLSDVTRYLKSNNMLPEYIISPFGPNEPDPIEFINTTVWLYTLQNPIIPQLMQIGQDFRHKETFFDFLLETKIIIHGATAHRDSLGIQEMKDELLYFCGCNIMIVDWHVGGSSPFLPKIISNSYIVGEQVSEFIKKLLTETNTDPGMIHLIGHSVGAHICGTTGRLLNGIIGRITGLDPSSHHFDNQAPEGRLDRSDAQFVDVIHTGAAPKYGVGTALLLGDIDFFPNGGEEQLGCYTQETSKNGDMSIFKSVQKKIKDQFVESTCHHSRAYLLFSETIGKSASKLVATPCHSYKAYLKGECGTCTMENRSCAIFGILAMRRLSPTADQQRFYITTNSSYPYFG